jgi:hypothetical protein
MNNKDGNDYDDFCRNYEVNVLNDSKRRARYRMPKFFQQPDDAADDTQQQ